MSASSSSQEQQFSIQPHPAKSNNPADLAAGDAPQSGLDSQSRASIFHAPGPLIPSEDIVKNLEQPKTREELHARAAELNKRK